MGTAAETLEVRWFQPGPLPQPASAWFLDAPEPAITESRIDEYLDMSGRDDLGVKVRGGILLELKLRTGVNARPRLTEGFDGQVESWAKWGFPLHPASPLPARGPHDWRSVEKTRRTRFYEVMADDGAIHAHASGDLPAENGCAAELVEVRLGTEVAWGLGFEAFGPLPDLLRVLIAGMNAFVTDTPLGSLRFAKGDSHSYPSFLSQWPPR